MSINLGKGIYAQTALQTDTIHLLAAQKTFKVIRWATYKFYKNT
ncbi:MAG: hypothetical protein ABIN01_25135 [Ferruginibacter sp.]